MIRVSRIIVLATVLSASAAVNDATTSWPQFRGPNSSGIGAGKPPVQFGPNQNVLWKTPLGPGLSSPVIWGSRIFVTEVDRTKKRLDTLCIDRHSGKVLWRGGVSAAAIEDVHELSSPAGATPVTDGERVYVYFGSYGLAAYDLNGKQIWEKRLPLPENPYGAVASPIVAGELLVLNHQGKESYLLALNRRDGKRSGKRTDRCSSMDGPLLCIWRHDGTDEISY